MSGNLVVAVRVRPLDAREIENDSQSIIDVHKEQITVTEHPSDEKYSVQHRPVHSKTFSFDHVYGIKSTNVAIYEGLGIKLLEQAFTGYNCCIFAYGQTGSGKSYTMTGAGVEKGIVPMICEELFRRIDSQQDNIRSRVEVSYLEIYAEKVRDLLSSNLGTNLRVREHPVTGPYVEDISRMTTTDCKTIISLLQAGNKQRTIASTDMNAVSSRSHAIFTITLSQTCQVGELETERISKINLVDLAGSERVRSTGSTGQRLKEGADINKSLTSLGRVISALATQQSSRAQGPSKQIPYRDSTLTWLLKDSLGGNSLTAMIATISPADLNRQETLSTLRYADSAKKIRTHAVVNEDKNTRMIRELQAELAALRATLARANSQGNGLEADSAEGLIAITSPDGTITHMSAKEIAERMVQSSKLIDEINLSWEDKLSKTRSLQHDLKAKFEDLGIYMEDDFIGMSSPRKIPHLLNLSEDPYLTELLIYNLRAGKTHCGRIDNSRCEIKLSGPSIHSEHCIFTNVQGLVTVEPIADAIVSVNGAPITKCHELSTGDQVVLGEDGAHIFRFIDPQHARAKNLEMRPSIQTPSPVRSKYADESRRPNIGETTIDLASVMSNTNKVPDNSGQVTNSRSVTSLSLGSSIARRASGIDLSRHKIISSIVSKQRPESEINAEEARNFDSQDVETDRLLQQLNAKRLHDEARGTSRQTSFIERLESVRDEASKTLGFESLVKYQTLQSNRARPAATLVRSIRCLFQNIRWTRICRLILDSGHALKRAQILARALNAPVVFQFCIQDRQSPHLSPLEDDEVYMAQFGSSGGTAMQQLMVRVMDLSKGVIVLWTIQKLHESLDSLSSLHRSRTIPGKLSILEKPLPRYVLFGSAALPVSTSQKSATRVFTLDIYSPHTTMTCAVLKVSIDVIADTDCDLLGINGSVVNLNIISISGIDEQEITEIHVHAYLKSKPEARLTTQIISNFDQKTIVLNSRHSCNLPKSSELDAMVFQVYGVAQKAFLDKLVSWDEMQEFREPNKDDSRDQVGHGCALVRIQISELNTSGMYQPCEILSLGLHDRGIIQLHQGLSRRISLIFEDQDGTTALVNDIKNPRMRGVSLLTKKDRAGCVTDESGTVALQSISSSAKQFRSDTHSRMEFQCQWDSSMHNSEYLDRTTSANDVVQIQLVFDRELSNRETVEIIAPLTLQIRGREEQISYFSRIFSFMRILPDVSLVYNLPCRQARGLQRPILMDVDTSEAYVPGQVSLERWAPRGLSLVRNHILMYKARCIAFEHQSTLLLYSRDQLSCSKEVGTTKSCKSSSTRDIDIRDIVDFWQHSVALNPLDDLEERVLATYSLRERKPICFPFNLGKAFSHSGELFTNDTNQWLRSYFVLESPYLLRYASSDRLNLLSAMYIPLYKMSVNQPLEFTLSTTHRVWVFRATTAESMNVWAGYLQGLATA